MAIKIKESKKGTLHDALNVPRDEKIPASKLKIKESDSPALKKKKQFAINAKKWKKAQAGETLEPRIKSRIPIEAQEKLESNISMSPENLFKGFKRPDKPKEPSNLSEILALSLMGINAIIPEDKIKNPVVRPEIGYNPYPEGMGSQAIAKSGIKVSRSGYKKTSKDKNEPKLRIPTNKITMQDVDFPLLGIDNTGFQQVMLPGKDYEFPGEYVDEYPLFAQAGAKTNPPIYISNPNDPRLKAYNDSLNLYNSNYRVPEGFKFVGKSLRDKYGEGINDYKAKNNIPLSILHFNNPSPILEKGRFVTDIWQGEFAKPVQPVIYQKPYKADIAIEKQQLLDTDNTNNLPGFEGFVRPEYQQKKTPYSFTYHGGEGDRDQRVLYFNTKKELKDFIGQYANQTSGWGDSADNENPYSTVGTLKKMQAGGKVESLTEDTFKINGPSHSEGGVKMSYGGVNIEAEGGETGFISPIDNSLNIMGNMINPLTGKKFKDDSKVLAKKEQKINKLLDYSTDIVNNTNPSDKWDILKFNSGAVQMIGAGKKKQELLQSKEHLSTLQKAMLDFSAENNLDPIDFSKGKITASKGAKIESYKQGGTIKAQPGAKLDFWNSPASMLDPDKYLAAIFSNEGGKTGIDPPIKGKASGKYALMPDTQKEIHKKYFKDMSWENFKKQYDTDAGFEYQVARKLAEEKIRTNKTAAEAIGSWYYPKAIKQGNFDYVPRPDYGNKITVREYVNRAANNYQTGKNEQRKGSIYGTEDQQRIYNDLKKPLKFDPKKPSQFADYQYSPDKVTPQQYNTEVTSPRPIVNNSYKRSLSFPQVAPEIMALADNQVDSVFLQQFQPELFQDYRVSFQDQLNENQASFIPLSRSLEDNPEALAILAAQKYQADSQVLANQFRTNQAIQQDIVNKNTGLLNDATLKNLQLADTQYTRQTKAKSNTKLQNQLALASIADKVTQNELEKRTLSVYENMFPYYQFDKNYRVNYTGPSPSEVLQPISLPNSQANDPQLSVIKDKGGNTLRTIERYPSNIQQQINSNRLRNQNLDWLKSLQNISGKMKTDSDRYSRFIPNFMKNN